MPRLSPQPACPVPLAGPSAGRSRRARSAALALACLCVAVLCAAGCDRLQRERGRATAERQTQRAIQAYSDAAERANAAHKPVLDAFAAANRSASVAEYRTALRDKVLPAMDAFVRQLETMPTGTPELVRIHGQLLGAWRKARTQVDTFEKSLDTATGLQRFDTIRAELQESLRAYRAELKAYYAAQHRQLVDAPAGAGDAATSPAAAPAAATPAAATGSAAP